MRETIIVWSIIVVFAVTGTAWWIYAERLQQLAVRFTRRAVGSGWGRLVEYIASPQNLRNIRSCGVMMVSFALILVALWVRSKLGG